MSRIQKLIDPKHLAAIFLVSVVAMASAYIFGVPSGNDQVQHFQMISSFNAAITRGDLFPSFASEANHGFGDLSVRFYPPLLYYGFVAAGHLFGDWYFGSLAIFTLIFLVGAFGVYAWAATEFGPNAGLIAAVLFTLGPYHLNEMYNNALLAEFAAAAVLPWCFFFIARLCNEPKWIWSLGLAFISSLLLLTHLPLTIIGGCAMAIYFVSQLRRQTTAAAIGYAAAAAVTAAILTAFYWTRWLPELSWIAHSSPKYFEATWGFRNNFLLLPSHFFGTDDLALNLWFADLMLAASLLLVIPTVVFLITRKLDRSQGLVALGITLAVAVVMTTPLSLPIWNGLGFMQKVQFPWRWMAVVGPFLAVFASVGIAKVFDERHSGVGKVPAIGLAIALAAVAFVDVMIVRGPTYLSRTAINSQIEAAQGASGCDCWWPVWADTGAFAQTERIVADGRKIGIEKWEPDQRSFTVGQGHAETASVATFYYPRWHATVNGQETPVRIGKHGQIEIPLPTDAAQVELKFVEPYYVGWAKIVSGLALIGLLTASFFLAWRTKI
ncbi:MAG: 6-pyruvoyl-tetrahydropterin synthase-related protein [Pyrinomonadaceae bacterium]